MLNFAANGIDNGKYMPLVVDRLQLWTIGFKWASLDPSRLWLRIPESVRDNFSTLLEAILLGHLECLSLASEKYSGEDPELAKYYIRHWLDDVYAGINGQYCSRKLLKHAVINRGDFQDWCERRSIPLPEFWFPPGWIEYRWPEEDFDPVPSEPVDAATELEPTAVVSLDTSALTSSSLAEVEQSSAKELKPVQLAKIVCKQIARVIWKEEPYKTITDMSRDEKILKFGGGQYYSEEVVRRWVKEAAPSAVSAKRGRPKKTNPTEDD